MALAQRAVRGALLVAGSMYTTMVVNFVTAVVLMRLLLPEHFGVFALATFFLVLFGRIRDWGFDSALIHRQDQVSVVAASHLLLNAALGLLHLGLAGVAALILPRFYNPLVGQALLVLAAASVVEAIGRTPRTLLEKELRFGPVTVFNLLGVLGGAAVAILLAVAGAGFWSLVAQRVIFLVLPAVAVWLLRPARLRLRWDPPSVRWLFRFCLPIWLAGIASLIVLQFDDFIVGSMVGMVVLGYYARAYQLAVLPTGVITHVISRVATPVYAKLQSDGVRLSRAFNLALSGIVRVAVPLALFLATETEDFVVILFGEKWLPMAPLFRLLLGYCLLRPLFDDTGALLGAIGYPQKVFRVLLLQAVALVVLLPPVTFAYGVVGTAVLVSLVMLVGVVLIYRTAAAHVRVQYVRVFGPVALASLLGVGGLLAVRLPLEPWGLFVGFAAKGVFFVVLYGAGLLALQRRGLIEEVHSLWRLLRGVER